MVCPIEILCVELWFYIMDGVNFISANSSLITVFLDAPFPVSMYVRYVCTCTCVCVHVYIYMYLHLCNLCACVYACMCVCMCVCVCAHVCVFVCMHACVCVRMYMCMWVWVCVYVFLSVCMCVHARANALVYVFVCVWTFYVYVCTYIIIQLCWYLLWHLLQNPTAVAKLYNINLIAHSLIPDIKTFDMSKETDWMIRNRIDKVLHLPLSSYIHAKALE